jgi:hypothetical protein
MDNSVDSVELRCSAPAIDLDQGTWRAVNAHESGMRTNWQFGYLEGIAIAVLAMSAATIIWLLLS